MSWVTNVMLSLSDPRNEGLVQDLNAWIGDHSSERDGFASITIGPWGGSKGPECRVFATSLNHYDLAALLGRIESLPWWDRGCVQVFINDQEDCSFGVWMFRGDELAEVLAPTAWDGDRTPFNANAMRSPDIQRRFRT